jgi:hypothetical protein
MEKRNKDIREFDKLKERIENETILPELSGTYNKRAGLSLEIYRKYGEAELLSRLAKIKDLLDTGNSVRARLERGKTGYLKDVGCNLVALLFIILDSSQGKYSNFTQQGVIMGLMDFLTKHRAHPAVATHYEKARRRRESLIMSQANMSLLEVRAPVDCSLREYAILLEIVLKSADESVDYCDTKALMLLAEKEIPGVMRLLQTYPLRLTGFGKANRGGFTVFNPYEHMLVMDSSGAMGKGSVHRCSNEVSDMTVPLAIGLNLSLFTDPYTVLPVLFHEHEHFLGDRNEASVFLKTHLFSQALYQKYPEADATRNSTYMLLKRTVFGDPPEEKRYETLNRFIKKLYGSMMTCTEAEQAADKRIKVINKGIVEENKKLEWLKEIPFPLLTMDEDAESTTVIREILLRYYMTPRTISQDEFREILKKYGRT